MDIAIIGAGNVGTSLATAIARGGHRVTIASRDPEHAARAAEASGGEVGSSTAAAAGDADIIVLAVPFSSVPEVATEISDASRGKTVIDVTNRMSYGADGPDIDTTFSNAEEIAQLLPDAHVVKAFNTVFATNQSDPITEGVRLDGYVAGDDADSKAAVLDLVRSIGLEPVDVGPLARARQLEGLAFLNIAIQLKHDGTWQSGWKLVAAPKTVKAAA